MKWYYTIAGGHTHVRVFMNGGKCGDLCFRNEEFQRLMEQEKYWNHLHPFVTFIDETPCPQSVDLFNPSTLRRS